MGHAETPQGLWGNRARTFSPLGNPMENLKDTDWMSS